MYQTKLRLADNQNHFIVISIIYQDPVERNRQNLLIFDDSRYLTSKCWLEFKNRVSLFPVKNQQNVEMALALTLDDAV